jgi:hypothetical protein
VNDDDVHVNATQYNNEVVEENIELVGLDETHLQFVDHTHNKTTRMNFNEGFQALQENQEKLTFPNHLS